MSHNTPSPAVPWHVVVLEDDPDTRSYFQSCLESHPRFRLAGSFETLASVRDWFAQPHHTADVLLTDLALPDGNAITLIEQVSRTRPDCDCLTRLDQWRDDRSLLDEVPDPPGALPCVGKRHNKELAASLPIAEVHRAGKSLAASVDAMFECPALLDAIERTYNRTPDPTPPA